MTIYRVMGRNIAFKKMGEFKVASTDEAIEMALEEGNCDLTLCFHCDKEVSGVEFETFVVEGEAGNYTVLARNIAFKNLGEYDVESPTEAIDMAYDEEDGELTLCYHCEKEVSGVELESLIAEKD